jgi:hypothetical protein
LDEVFSSLRRAKTHLPSSQSQDKNKFKLAIPTSEINKILSTEMDALRRSVRKSRMERTKNEHIKEIMGAKGKPDIIDIIEKKRLK